MHTTAQSAAAPERRAFQMHTNLLRDVIERQAGSLDKAVLEGVMNLIEAGATRGDITLTKRRLTIVDDGRGFTSRQEVLDAFEMFGKSDERKQEHKRFAQFQMGRGQLFAFGKTSYRTHTFEMLVDIRSDIGLGYDLTESLDDVSGCTIVVDLFDSLDDYQIGAIMRKIGAHIKYVDVPIFLNGVQVTEDPAKLKWSLETDNAYYRFVTAATSRLDVYNLGVLVESTTEFGIGGTVISKRQLTLNFARNQVIRSCPKWKRIRSEFRERTEVALIDKKSFTTEDASVIIDMLKNGDIERWKAASLRLLRDTNRKQRSFHELARKTIAFDKRGSTKADKVMLMDPKIIILDREHATEVLGATDRTFNRLLENVLRLMAFSPNEVPRVIPIEELYIDLSDDSIVLADRDVDKVVRLALECARSAASEARHLLRIERGSNAYPFEERHIAVGRSDTSTAWTDGVRSIVITESTLKGYTATVSGWSNLMLALAELYAYTDAERTRDADFFERYYEYSMVFVQPAGKAFRKFAKAVLKQFPDKASRFRAEATAAETIEGENIDSNGGAAA